MQLPKTVRFGNTYRVFIPIDNTSGDASRQEANVAETFLQNKRNQGIDAEKEFLGESWFIHTDEGTDEAVFTYRDWKHADEKHSQAEEKADREHWQQLSHRLRDRLDQLILHATQIDKP